MTEENGDALTPSGSRKSTPKEKSSQRKTDSAKLKPGSGKSKPESAKQKSDETLGGLINFKKG